LISSLGRVDRSHKNPESLHVQVTVRTTLQKNKSETKRLKKKSIINSHRFELTLR